MGGSGGGAPLRDAGKGGGVFVDAARTPREGRPEGGSDPDPERKVCMSDPSKGVY